MEDLEVIKERIAFYLQHEKDPHFIKLTNELVAQNNQDLLKEFFMGSITFGTGGLRGLIEPGFTTINPLTIHLASQGLGNYAKKLKNQPLSAVVSYDTRAFSYEFALMAACTFASLGIKVHMFEQPTPVPILSYTINHMQADFGVMITASHNPKEYNGYKVYWDAGEQVVSPHDVAIEQGIKQSSPIAVLSPEEAVQQGLLYWLDHSALKPYMQAMLNLDIIKFALPKAPHKISSKICYTPLHGSGLYPIQQLLESTGFNLIIPAQQQNPDGNFLTVKTPNPEDVENLKMAIELAKKESATLVLATDPDADRLGVAVLHNHKFIPLSGNQIGSLILFFIASTLHRANKLNSRLLFVNTVVTTTLQNSIAKEFGIQSQRVLTGFKHIAEVIAKHQGAGDADFIFGCEESYGYLIHTFSRDKDAVSAALLVALMHDYYTRLNLTLVDVLQEIAHRHGYYEDQQLSYTLTGLNGAKQIQQMMQELAQLQPTWANLNCTIIHNYQKQQSYEVTQTKLKQIDSSLPKTNLIQYEFSDGTLISARPSGTEPKIKFYLSTKGDNREGVLLQTQKLKEDIDAFVQGYL